MATLEQELEVGVLTAVKAAFDQNQSTLDNIIVGGENALVGAATAALSNLAKQKVSGIFGPEVQLVESALDPIIEGQVQALISKYGAATVINTFIDAKLSALISAA